MKSTLFFLQLDFYRFHMFSGIKLNISLVSVYGFWWIMVFWKRYEHFIAKFGSKVEICWKLEEFRWISRITSKFQVICWHIYNFSERFWCRLFNKPQKFTKLAFCKKKFVNNKVLKAVGTVPKNGFSQKRLLRFF
jgi:hypothetical protein